MFISDERPLTTLDFNPYNPVRSDVIREVVYIKKWQKLMFQIANYYPCEIKDGTITFDTDDMIRTYDDGFHDLTTIYDILDYIPNSHDTKTASNVIRWLGSNLGYAFINEAKTMYEGTDKSVWSLEDVYLSIFAKKNIRERMLNRGSVPYDNLCVEFEKSHIPQGFFHDENVMKKTHKHALNDVLTVNRIIHWLASKTGQKFIESCERNINIKHSQEREARRTNTVSTTTPVQQWLSKRPHPFP